MSKQKNSNSNFICSDELSSLAPYIARFTDLEVSFCIGIISCEEFSHWTFELLSEAVAFASSLTLFGAFSKLILTRYNSAVLFAAERED